MTSEPASNTLQIQSWLYFRMEKKLITLLTIEGRNIKWRKFLAVSGHSWWKSQLWEFWVGRVPSLPLSVAGRAELHVKKYHFPLPLKEIQFVGGIFTPIVFSCHWCHVRAWTTATITWRNLSTHHTTTSLSSPLQEYQKYEILANADSGYHFFPLLQCDPVRGLQSKSVWWLFMINQAGCIVWSGLGLELKLVSLFSNNQVNSGAKTKAADLWGSRGGWTYHLFTPRHAPRAPWAPWSTLATQHDGWTFYLSSRNGLSHTSHISHLSGLTSTAPPQPLNHC